MPYIKAGVIMISLKTRPPKTFLGKIRVEGKEYQSSHSPHLLPSHSQQTARFVEVLTFDYPPFPPSTSILHSKIPYQNASSSNPLLAVGKYELHILLSSVFGIFPPLFQTPKISFSITKSHTTFLLPNPMILVRENMSLTIFHSPQKTFFP